MMESDYEKNVQAIMDEVERLFYEDFPNGLEQEKKEGAELGALIDVEQMMGAALIRFCCRQMRKGCDREEMIRNMRKNFRWIQKEQAQKAVDFTFEKKRREAEASGETN